MIFLANKYARWYDSIIERARGRFLEGYAEKHHVLPRALGGDDSPENLVSLTLREHILCHWLLTKMLDDQQAKRKMSFAFNLLAFGRTERTKDVTRGGIIKRAAARACRGARLGIRHTVEARNKMSKSRIGKKQTAQQKAKRAETLRGSRRTHEQKCNISNALKGFTSRMTPEKLVAWKQAQSISHLGKVLSESTRAKMSAARLGKPRSSEARRNMSEAWHTKYTWTIKDPQGNIHVTANLREFSAERGLKFDTLRRSLVTGIIKRGMATGWCVVGRE